MDQRKFADAVHETLNGVCSDGSMGDGFIAALAHPAACRPVIAIDVNEGHAFTFASDSGKIEVRFACGSLFGSYGDLDAACADVRDYTGTHSVEHVDMS